MSSLQSLVVRVQEGACELVREGFEDFTVIIFKSSKHIQNHIKSVLSRVTTYSKSHQEEIMFRGLDRE